MPAAGRQPAADHAPHRGDTPWKAGSPMVNRSWSVPSAITTGAMGGGSSGSRSIAAAADELLFDDYGEEGDLAADARSLIFTREGSPWWRKGYHGSQAAQVWRFDRDDKTFTKLLDPDTGARWPLWRPDGKGFYYVGQNGGALNLRERHLESSAGPRLDRVQRRFGRLPVHLPRRFDDRLSPPVRLLSHPSRHEAARPNGSRSPATATMSASAGSPNIACSSSRGRSPSAATDWRSRSSPGATSGSWTRCSWNRGSDGHARGGTRPRRSPPRATRSFRQRQGRPGRHLGAERGEPSLYWWQNTQFRLERLTQDAEVESDLSGAPKGRAWPSSRGAATSGSWTPRARRPAGWSRRGTRPSTTGRPTAPGSSTPGGRGLQPGHLADPRRRLAAARSTSRATPTTSRRPVWSPDGKTIAFTGRRVEDEVDIYYIWLRAEDDETTRATGPWRRPSTR